MFPALHRYCFHLIGCFLNNVGYSGSVEVERAAV